MKSGSIPRAFRLCAVLISLTFGCGNESPNAGPEKRGAAPPPSVTGAAGAVVCSRTAIDDAETKSFFAAEAGGFCLDPKDGGKALGDGTKNALEGIADLFDGESKIYEDHGVRRVVQLRYVAKAGGAATIDIILSRFASDTGAYGMFSKRVVGDGDPADPATPKPLAAGGAAALGTGAVTLWRGSHLLEIVYNDDSKSPADIEREGNAALVPLARQIGDALPGDKAPPALVALLPEANRLPLGVRVLLKGALPGVAASVGAVGYYAEQGKRYRVFVIEAADEAKAKALLASVPAANAVAGVADEAVRADIKEATASGNMLVARRGARVIGLSNELRVFGGAGKPTATTALGFEEKKSKLASLLP